MVCVLMGPTVKSIGAVQQLSIKAPQRAVGWLLREAGWLAVQGEAIT